MLATFHLLMPIRLKGAFLDFTIPPAGLAPLNSQNNGRREKAYPDDGPVYGHAPVPPQ